MAGDSSSSWFRSFTSCCCPSSPRLDGRNRLRRTEKDGGDIWSDEPTFTPPPSFAPRPVTGHAQPVGQQMQWPSLEQAPPYSAVTGAPPAGDGSARQAMSGPHFHSRSLTGSRSAPMVGRSSMSSRRRVRTHGSSSSLSIFSLSSSRRPQISAPTNFRHLHSESFAFPPVPQEPELPPMPQPLPQESHSYHPLELSIYREQGHISPLADPFERNFAAGDAAAGDQITVPPQAHTHDGSSRSASRVGHERSYSTMSFHVPRRPPAPEWTPPPIANSAASTGSATYAGDAGGIDSDDQIVMSSPPPLKQQGPRMRSYSSPAVETMVERIANAMIEMERLQAEIDTVIERQSICISSRPSTAYGQDFDTMTIPAMPAMPPAAPSFAERLSTDRPKTAPPRNSAPLDASMSPSSATHADVALSPRAMPSSTTTVAKMAKLSLPDGSSVSVASAASVVSAAEAASKAKVAAAARSGPRINGRLVDVPLAPPLPLVLRPPLRKKKSFSRVSRWLFTAGEAHGAHETHGQAHSRGLSLDSVTNLPRPVTQKEGFYQCVMPPEEVAERASLDTVSTNTLSTWTTNRDTYEGHHNEEYVTCDEDNGREEGTRAALTAGWSQRSSPVTTTATTVTPVAAVTPAAGKPAALGSGKGPRPQSVGVAF